MKLIKRFTDNYRKDDDSNISKLLSIFNFESDRVNDAFRTIDDYRHISNATGVTLDNIGKNVLLDRDGMDDVTYRLFLRLKIKMNLSGGQIKTINEIMPQIMGINFLYFREVWNDPIYFSEPAAIEISYLNLFDMVKGEYESLENDLWYFDGKYSLDGAKSFDGGYIFSYSEFKVMQAIQKMKDTVNFIKAAGVRVWWRQPVGIETLINIANDVTISLQKPTETPIIIVNDAEICNHYDVYNASSFLFDGMYVLNGEMSFDGNRPFIAHDVEITEVSA